MKKKTETENALKELKGKAGEEFNHWSADVHAAYLQKYQNSGDWLLSDLFRQGPLSSTSNTEIEKKKKLY